MQDLSVAMIGCFVLEFIGEGTFNFLIITLLQNATGTSLQIFTQIVFSHPGLLTAVHRNYFCVLNHRELLFNDFGDRVAQLLHVESAIPFLQNRSSSYVQQQSLIVNTHLVFPHDHSLSIVRLKQV